MLTKQPTTKKGTKAAPAPNTPAPTPEHLRTCQAYHFAIAEYLTEATGDVVERAEITSGAFPGLTTLFAYMANVVGEVPVEMVARYLTASESQVLGMIRECRVSYRHAPRDVPEGFRGLVTADEARAIKQRADRMLKGAKPL